MRISNRREMLIVGALRMNDLFEWRARLGFRPGFEDRVRPLRSLFDLDVPHFTINFIP
jgi:hypothetical protein